VTARLVVLLSGAGSNLAALIEAASDPSYGASVVAVGADRAGTGGADKAKAAGIPVFEVAPAAYAGREAWSAALAEQVAAHRPDLVVSAGLMRILSPGFVERFPVVNTHPALLPAFPGAHAVRDALAYGVAVTGCTVHWVDAGVDTGPVLAQVAVAVEPDDDEAALHERIKAVERPLLVEVVGRLAREGWTVEGRRTHYGHTGDAHAGVGRG
jgi:phosphoribosylglycinamide formyltransferase-1